VAVHEPRLNTYFTTRQTIGTPSVHIESRGDLYLSLAAIGESGVTLDVFWFPFVWLIWFGGGVMVAGGTWAWLARRTRRESTTATVEAAAHV
jgi:cytochrome c biogenesis factor